MSALESLWREIPNASHIVTLIVGIVIGHWANTKK
jgi:hypothetical protein